MIHDSERESASNHNAMIRRRRKIAEDVRERTLRRTHRYYPSTKHSMQSVSPLTGEALEPSALRRPSPQELAERAAIILALNVTSGKTSLTNPS